jgi:predicted RND superfamily exporter protein
MRRPFGSSTLVAALIALATVVSAWLTAERLRVSTDLSTLVPDSADAGALSRWMHAFGAVDPALVLVRGDRPEAARRVAERMAEALRRAPSVARVMDRVPAPAAPPDPTVAWAYAGPEARRRLAAAVTPEGMRERLEETRALLLAPGADTGAQAWLARDPLRLLQIPWASRVELASGVSGAPEDAFVADGGRARLVIAQPRGSPFESASARAFVADVDRAEVAAGEPGVTIELAGGHAIAAATEQMLRRDLETSGALSVLLASVAFVVTFRRARALLAVLPPLALGTLWTTGLAALWPTGVSAVAVAFAAVVVGVGVDTGVHVYAALLAARREGFVGREAAEQARARTWRPTLIAAAVAAMAFASLAVSGLRGMKQLGLLCGAGELLTAVAIVLVTPEIGRLLERGAPPPAADAGWVRRLDRLLATRTRAAVALALCALPAAIVAVVGWPRPADALVAVRPRGLAPLVAGDHVQAFFEPAAVADVEGPRPQWIVLTVDPDEAAAGRRADRVADALEALRRDGTIVGYDALATFAPSASTQRARLAERDALDLPARRVAFEDALRDAGFDLASCAPALAAFAHPSEALADGASGDASAWLFARHVAHEPRDVLVATYVRPKGEPAADAAARAAIQEADPAALVTGFDAIDRALRAALSRDLLLVGGLAFAVVALGTRLALRRAWPALVAMAALACEMGAVGLAMRALGVHWHVYDALVLPVLFGVTIDESMFLLHAARGSTLSESLRSQGPLVAATSLTTAAGFAALIACRFDGLRDLGEVGAVGVLAGLVASLVVVPAAVRLLGARV